MGRADPSCEALRFGQHDQDVLPPESVYAGVKGFDEEYWKGCRVIRGLNMVGVGFQSRSTVNR
jgi:hypothetical protein